MFSVTPRRRKYSSPFQPPSDASRSKAWKSSADREGYSGAMRRTSSTLISSRWKRLFESSAVNAAFSKSAP